MANGLLLGALLRFGALRRPRPALRCMGESLTGATTCPRPVAARVSPSADSRRIWGMRSNSGECGGYAGEPGPIVLDRTCHHYKRGGSLRAVCYRAFGTIHIPPV